MDSRQVHNQHIWWRAGFGPPAGEQTQLLKQKPGACFHSLLHASQGKPDLFDVADPELKALFLSERMNSGKTDKLKPEDRQMLRRHSVIDIAKLNLRWLQEMTESPAQLREKMSLFWHGHFATKTVNIFYDQALLQIIRENALGNFRDLLFQVSRSASMIQFLNTNQNRKTHPNENFARELMELFTIGRGHYTEQDVKESARAFTGWGISPQGVFELRNRQHDDGVKTFFGKTGNLSGDDILDIILSNKQTAVFITRKIYRFFVNDRPDEEVVATLASRFFDSGYDIQALLVDIFTSSWFYNPENIGSQIKSPVVWLVGMRRQLPMEIQDPQIQLVLERLLGQVLFAPPNVAGWPGGTHWIDSSSLMLRMEVPHLIYRSATLTDKPKSDDDVMMGVPDRLLVERSKKNPMFRNQGFDANIAWESYIKYLESIPDTGLFNAIRSMLLQRAMPMKESDLDKYVDGSSREKRIESLTIRVMGTPEYQMC